MRLCESPIYNYKMPSNILSYILLYHTFRKKQIEKENNNDIQKIRKIN